MKVKDLIPYFGEIHWEEEGDEAKYVILGKMTDGRLYTVPTSGTVKCDFCDKGIKMELTSNILTAILIKFPPINCEDINVRQERKVEIAKFFKQVAKEQGLI